MLQCENALPLGARGKVFVLGDDVGAGGAGLTPDVAVVGFAQTNFTDRLRLMAGFAQPMRQGGRQLGVDEELHLPAN